jgi:hypothetical protein
MDWIVFTGSLAFIYTLLLAKKPDEPTEYAEIKENKEEALLNNSTQPYKRYGNLIKKNNGKINDKNIKKFNEFMAKIKKDNKNALNFILDMNSIKNKENKNRKIIFLSIDNSLIDTTNNSLNFKILTQVIMKLINHILLDDFIIIKCLDIKITYILSIFQLIYHLIKHIDFKTFINNQFNMNQLLKDFNNLTNNNAIYKSNNVSTKEKLINKLKVMIKRHIKDNVLVISNDMESNISFDISKFKIYRLDYSDKEKYGELKKQIFKNFEYIDYIYINYDKLKDKIIDIIDNRVLLNYYKKGYLNIYYLNIKYPQVYRNFYKVLCDDTVEYLEDTLDQKKLLSYVKNNRFEVYSSLHYLYYPFIYEYDKPSINIHENTGPMILFNEIRKKLGIDVFYIASYKIYDGTTNKKYFDINDTTQLDLLSELAHQYYVIIYMSSSSFTHDTEINILFISKEIIFKYDMMKLQNKKASKIFEIHKNIYIMYKNSEAIETDKINIFNNWFIDSTNTEIFYINIFKFFNIKTGKENAIIHIYITIAGVNAIASRYDLYGDIIKVYNNFISKFCNKKLSEANLLMNIMLSSVNSTSTNTKLENLLSITGRAYSQVENFIYNLYTLVNTNNFTRFLMKSLGPTNNNYNVIFSTFPIVLSFKIPKVLSPYQDTTKSVQPISKQYITIASNTHTSTSITVNENDLYTNDDIDLPSGPPFPSLDDFLMTEVFKDAYDFVIKTSPPPSILPIYNGIFIKFADMTIKKKDIKTGNMVKFNMVPKLEYPFIEMK